MRSQEKISQDLIGPSYRNPDTGQKLGEKSPEDTQRWKANQISRKGDEDLKNFKVGLQDIDEAILYYFKQVISPQVETGGTVVSVPVLYAAPEKWKAVQRDGVYRDREGKQQYPIILYKRDSLQKVRNITTKLDANRPHNWYVTKVKYSARNSYDRFGITFNGKPQHEYVVSTVPDYIKVQYSCTILTEYIEHMNQIVESVNFASDSYWGDPEKFMFQSFIDEFRTETTVSQGEDRTVKSDFVITLNGYVLPSTVNANPYTSRKVFGKTHVKVSMKEKVIRNL